MGNSPSREFQRPPTPPPVKKNKNNKNKKEKKKPNADVDACGSDKNIHQLKMYWEEGFDWGDKDKSDKTEKAWCAECANNCQKEEDVLMRECDNKMRKQFWIFSGCKVQSFANPKVCITTGEARRSEGSLKGKIGLYACKDDKVQEFRTFGTDVSAKFQFETFEKEGNADLCLTTEGRPKDAKELRFTDCEVAKNNGDLTNYWEVGVFGGHTGARKVGVSKNIKSKKGKSKKKKKGGGNKGTN